MANYNLVIDTSNFKPMSYKDIMAPYEDYSKDYDVRRAELQDFIDKYGNLNLPEGSKAAQDYENYKQQSLNAMDAFYKYGLNTRTGNMLRAAFDMNRGTVSKMKEVALEYKQKLERRQELENQGYIVDGLSETTQAQDFDAMMKGKFVNPKAINSKDIVTGAMQYFKGLDNANMNMGNATARYNQILDGQYWLYIKQGMDSEKAMAAATAEMPQLASLDSELQKYMRSYAKSIGIDRFGDEAQLRIWHTIGVGLISSIEDRTKELANANFESDAARADRLLREQATNLSMAATRVELQDKGYTQDDKGNFTYNANNDKRNPYYYALNGLSGNGAANGLGAAGGIHSSILGIDYGPADKDGKRLGSDGSRMTDKEIRAAEEKAKKDNPEEVELRLISELDVRRPYFKPINFRLWEDDSEEMYKPERYTGTDDVRTVNQKGKFAGGYSYSAPWRNKVNSEVKASKLSETVRQQILKEVHKQPGFEDITIDQLKIYKDYDFASNNHYRVVLRGSTEKGDYDETKAAKVKLLMQNKPAIPSGASLDSIVNENIDFYKLVGALEAAEALEAAKGKE